MSQFKMSYHKTRLSQLSSQIDVTLNNVLLRGKKPRLEMDLSEEIASQIIIKSLYERHIRPHVFILSEDGYSFTNHAPYALDFIGLRFTKLMTLLGAEYRDNGKGLSPIKFNLFSLYKVPIYPTEKYLPILISKLQSLAPKFYFYFRKHNSEIVVKDEEQALSEEKEIIRKEINSFFRKSFQYLNVENKWLNEKLLKHFELNETDAWLLSLGEVQPIREELKKVVQLLQNLSGNVLSDEVLTGLVEETYSQKQETVPNLSDLIKIVEKLKMQVNVNQSSLQEFINAFDVHIKSTEDTFLKNSENKYEPTSLTTYLTYSPRLGQKENFFLLANFAIDRFALEYQPQLGERVRVVKVVDLKAYGESKIEKNPLLESLNVSLKDSNIQHIVLIESNVGELEPDLFDTIVMTARSNHMPEEFNKKSSFWGSSDKSLGIREVFSKELRKHEYEASYVLMQKVLDNSKTKNG